MMTTMSVRTDTLVRKSNAALGLSAPVLPQADTVSGLVGWYDATRQVMVPSGDNVSSWGNLATGMGAAIAPSTGARPAFVSDANGARIQFNGGSGYRNLTAEMSSLTVEKSTYIVAGVFSNANQGTFFEYNNEDEPTTPNTDNLILYGGAAGSYTHRVITNTANVSENDITLSVPNPTQDNIYWLGKGTSQQRVTNQLTPTNYTPPGRTATAIARRLHIGSLATNNSTWTHEGYIKEVLVYNKLLSNAEHQQVLNYLTAKYRLWTVQNNFTVGLLGRPALALDTFDGALATPVDNTRTMATGQNWLEANAVWELDGAGAVRVSLNSGDPTNNNFLWCGAGQANVIVSMRADVSGTTSDPGFGLAFNIQDRNSNWRVILQNGGTSVSCRRRVSGVVTNFDLGALFEPYAPQDIFSVMTQGDSFVLLKNGKVNSRTYTEANRPLKNVTQHGLASNFDAVANRGANVSEAFEFSVESY